MFQLRNRPNDTETFITFRYLYQNISSHEPGWILIAMQQQFWQGYKKQTKHASHVLFPPNTIQRNK